MIALEAALFFSVPSWMLTVDSAWPANEPYRFVLAVFVGAGLALLLCHVVPAMFAVRAASLFESRIGRLLRWPISAWFCIGACASLIQLAHGSGSMFVLWRDVPWQNQPFWRLVAVAITILVIGAAFLIAARRMPGAPWIVAALLGLGFILAIASLWANSPGLHTRNPQMVSESPLGDPFQVGEAMLIAAAPASILAIRIGRIGRSPARALWTGICGVWLPLVTSVVLVSLAKMAGARLYWKPSLPIEFQYAFAWILQRTDSLRSFLWPLAFTMLPACIICALWITDLTSGIHGSLRKFIALVIIGISGFCLASSFAWSLYYSYWLWSIVIGSVAVGVMGIAPAVRSRFR